MAAPITIVVDAQTEAAAKAMQAFLGQTKAGIQAVEVQAVKMKVALNDSSLAENANAAVPAIRRLAQEFAGLGAKAGNSRLALMEIGHVIRATAEGMAAGISPTRVLAMELPRMAQAAALSGASIVTLGAGAASIIPIVIAGVEAWGLYKDKLYEVASAQNVIIQHADIRARLKAMLESNADRLNPGEADALQKRLSDATESGSIVTPRQTIGQGRSTRVVKPETTVQTEVLANVIKEVQARLKLVNLTDEQKKNLEEIDKIAEKSFANSLTGYAKDRELAVQENREINQKIALNSQVAKTDEDRRRVQQAYDFQRAAFAQKMADIDRREEEEKSKNLQKQADLVKKIEQSKTLSGLTGYQLQVATINDKFDSQIEEVKKMNFALAEQKRLIDEINESRRNELTGAFEANAKERTVITQQEAQKQIQAQRSVEDSTVSMLGSAADAAKLFGKQGFLAWKAFAMAQAVVAGALAVVRALSDGGPYAGPFLAAAAAAAAGVQLAVIASTQPSGYAEGGYTGDGGKYQAAGIVHKGEFVMPANRTMQFRPVLEAMHAGKMPSAVPAGGAGGHMNIPAPQVKVAVLNDRQELLSFLQESAGQNAIIEIVNRRRTDLGLPT